MTPIDQIFMAALIVGSGVLTIAALFGMLGHALLDIGSGQHGDVGADVGADMGSGHVADGGVADAGAHVADVGHAGTADAGTHHVHVDGGLGQVGLLGVALSYLSPVALAMTVAYFGLVGLGLRTVGASPTLAVILAIPVGVLLSRGTAKLVARCLAAGSQSSHEEVSRLLGRIADVTVAIPEKGYGQITVFAAGARMPYPARADRPLQAGVRVMIERIENGVAYVTLYDEDSGPSLLED